MGPQTTGHGRASTTDSDVTAIAPFAFLSTRLLVVTKQADGAIFVGGCEANGGSA